MPVLHELTHLPVIVDPSHATGVAWMVEPMAMAAAACGADGLIIEVHNDPPHALCDGAQSLRPEQAPPCCWWPCTPGVHGVSEGDGPYIPKILWSWTAAA